MRLQALLACSSVSQAAFGILLLQSALHVTAGSSHQQAQLYQKIYEEAAAGENVLCKYATRPASLQQNCKLKCFRESA